MRASREKIKIAMARACMNASDIAQIAKMPEPSVKNVILGKGVKAKTIGKVACALGVDVTEIIEEV